MDLERVYESLCSKKGATESFPFGPQPLVVKVMGKVFALVSVERIPPAVALKCDPERALLLRDRFAAVLPAYHMNKKHWNTVILDGSVPSAEINAMIEQSYSLVIKGLRRADRERLRASSDDQH